MRRRIPLLLLAAVVTCLPPARGDGPPDVEAVAKLTTSLRDAKEELATLEKQIADPMSEYTTAEKAFQEAEAELMRLKQKDVSGEDLPLWEIELEKANATRKAAHDRFQLAIAERKSQTAKREALSKQIEQDQKRLDQMTGVSMDPPPGGEKPVQPPAQPPVTTQPQPPVKPETPPTTPAPPLLPGVPTVPTAPADGTPTTAPTKPKEESAEVKQAREEAAAKRVELEKAEKEAKTFDERVKVLEQRITAESQLLKTHRRQSDQALQDVVRLTDELAGAPDDKKQDLLNELHTAQERVNSTRILVRETTDRLAELNVQLNTTRQDQAAALQEAEAKRQSVEEADKQLSTLLDPFTPTNLLRTGGEKLPKLIGILIGTIIAYFVARQFTRQVVRFITRTGHRGSAEDRENRANTLVGVFRYVANILVVGGGAVLLLDELGVPLVPLMGGAAVLGLAVAFGAQNLIRDYFSGFMILTEDQYGINDVVKIGGTAGLVEKVTLRVTVLRDLEGVLHFIPNGQITNVSNMTHGWSRALFDIPCPHTEDVDRVMDVIRGLGAELRADPVYGLKITDNLEMLGVETIEANASVVRFLIKTRPLQQWNVKREMLRRIKRRFDELGIAIPANRMSVVVTDANGKPLTPPESVPRLLAS